MAGAAAASSSDPDENETKNIKTCKITENWLGLSLNTGSKGRKSYLHYITKSNFSSLHLTETDYV